jgi:hypothetical protein
MSRSQSQSKLKVSDVGKPKKTTAYQKNKKAFDDIMNHLREMGRPRLAPLGAMNMEKSGGSPSSRNPVAPLPIEFYCDGMLAIQAALPKGVRLSKFIQAYLLWDSDDAVEKNVFAEKVLGGRVHSVEQRVGAEFVRRAIWPEAAYMFPKRQERPRNSF